MTPPIERRLLRRADTARRYFALVCASGLITAALVVAQAGLLAHVIARAPHGLTDLRGPVVALLAVLVARGAIGYLGEVAALRAAATVRSTLRRDIAAKILALGPGWAAGERSGEVATLMTRGLDAVDSYFSRYLPALVLAPLVPLVVIARVAGADLTSSVVIAVTVPLIPIFMALVGMHTKQRTMRQWRQLSRLGGHFLDVVEGLPTLKVFGRAKAQVATIRRVSNEYRLATLATLRVAFVSALVLELLATLATAVVAVEVGLRLLNGHLPYETALLVLLLTPEAYLPLRSLGTTFHASADGAAALSAAFDLLDSEAPLLGGSRRVDLRRERISLDAISVRYPERDLDAISGVTLEVAPGDHVVMLGASGAGKSTLLAALLGFVPIRAGSLTIGDIPVSQIDLTDLRRQIAWVPQSPRMFAGTVADNIRLGSPTASAAEVSRAVQNAGLADVIASLPDGIDTTLGDRGITLSTGQRQRVALARAFLRNAPLVLLDEPSAHLDAVSATELRTTVDRLALGRTVIVVTHDRSWQAGADRVIDLDVGRPVAAAERVLA